MPETNNASFGPSPWWTPLRHADRRPALLLRGRIKASLRQHFLSNDFLEVEPGSLQFSPGNEAHLHAFATEYRTEAGARSTLYLHTSPEFAMKKLLAAGEQRIFAFAPVFRNRERGSRHSSEFTMLEWYRAGEPYEAIMDDCVAIVRIAAECSNLPEWQHAGHRADPRAAPRRISMAEAFHAYAGIDLAATLHAGGVSRDKLAISVAAIGIRVADDDTWSDLFSRVLVERIDPALAALSAPVILDAYPTHEAALARPSAADPRFAEQIGRAHV